jgi:hypothetical protein
MEKFAMKVLLPATIFALAGASLVLLYDEISSSIAYRRIRKKIEKSIDELVDKPNGDQENKTEENENKEED